jgi:hypothetical protein
MFGEINQMLRTGVPIVVAVFAWIAVPAKAFARTIHDGDWGVLILTCGGACKPAVRCGVQITDGMIIYGGGMAAVQGRVTRRRSVQVMVRSGDRWANGAGRLGRNRGGGAWWGQGWGGQGTSGTCRGTWVAERRE